MFLVDTNILVEAANDGSPLHAPSRTLLDAWRGREDAWFTTWSIQYEFLRVVTHPRVLRRPWTVPAAWGFLEALHASPGFGVLVATERHAAVARRTLDEVENLAGNALHDAHIAILMREHGIGTIYTRDRAFRRFPFLEVVDPLGSVNEGRTRAPRRRKTAISAPS